MVLPARSNTTPRSATSNRWRSLTSKKMKTEMKTTLTFALLLISFGLSGARAQQKVQQKILVISDVTVIDATGAPAQPNMTVIITGDQISKIAKTGEVAIPKNAQVIDGKGKFVIPGLWDMHVHSVFGRLA